MRQKNTIVRKRGYGLLISVGLILVASAATAFFLGFEKLRDLYLEQCVITDFSEQVNITAGKMVKADVLAENLGLKPGANLALIDFQAKRQEMLRRIPTLREVTIERRLPGRIYIRAEERSPIARLNICGQRAVSGRVADSEGMVFLCVPGTQMLPTIRETPRGTAPGQFIKGRVRAALDLVLTCRESEFSDLGLLEVDTSKADFLVATLGDYSRVKISWENMDESTPAARAALAQRLRNLLAVIRLKSEGLKAVIWNATLPDYIFADTQEKIESP